MSNDNQPDWQTYAAVLAALVALASLVIQLRDEPDGAALLIYGLAVAGLLVWLVQRRLVPRPRLRRRTALRIDPKHFRGREASVDELCSHLRNSPLVWFIDDSGIGKSSVLELGLVKRLREGESFVPVYLEDWGIGWEEGPRDALRRAVHKVLASTEALRRQLEIDLPVTADQVTPILELIGGELARTPVLIFDHFDDYQVKHREHFLQDGGTAIIEPATLVTKNSFWNDISGLLEAGFIRCLFVARKDMEAGLACVRFCEEVSCSLTLLDKEHAADLLDEIIEANIDGGFTRDLENLKRKLLEDLGLDGGVLPSQMELAIHGLRNLDSFNAGHYEAEGRLPGLEARRIKVQIAEVARRVDLDKALIMRVLLELVEPDSQDPVSMMPSELMKALPETHRDKTRLGRALDGLAQESIVRQRIDMETGEAVWLLYNQHLGQSVVELDRASRRWQVMLDDAKAIFDEAQGIWNKWWALMPVPLQARLAFHRLMGDLRYGSKRSFALYSTARVVNVWTISVVVLFFVSRFLVANQEAQRLFYPFTSEEATSAGEASSLWALSSSKRAVKLEFFEIVFSDPLNVRRFLGKSDHVLGAVLGLNRDDRKGLLLSVIRSHCPRAAAVEHLGACIELLEAVPPGVSMEEIPDAVASHMAAAIMQTRDVDQLAGLADGLGALGSKLSDAAVEGVAIQIVDAMSKIKSSTQLAALEKSLGVLKGHLSATAMKKVVDHIVTFVAPARDLESRDLEQMSTLTRGLRMLEGGLPKKEIKDSSSPLASAVMETSNPEQLSALVHGFIAFGDRVSKVKVEGAFCQVVDVMGQTREGGQLSLLSDSLGTLADRLPKAAVERVAHRILDAMEQAEDMQLEFLARGLRALGPRLPASVADRIIDVMRRTEDAELLEALAGRWGVLERRLAEPAAEAGAGRIADILWPRRDADDVESLAVDQRRDSRDLESLAAGLGALGEKLPDDTARRAAEQIEVRASEAEAPELEILARGLKALGHKLPADLAKSAAERIVDVMEQNRTSDQLATLAGSLGGLRSQALEPGKRSVLEPLVARAADEILRVMAEIQGSRHLQVLAGGLVALGSPLPDTAAVRGFGYCLDAVGQTQDPVQLKGLVDCFEMLGDKLTVPEARKTADRFVDALLETRELGQLNTLALGLRELDTRLAGGKAQRLVAHFVDVVVETKGRSQLAVLADHLGDRMDEMSGARAQEEFLRVVGAIGQSEDRSQLSALAACLGVLGDKPPDGVEAADEIVGMMEESHDFGRLDSWVKGLVALGDRPSGVSITKAFNVIVDVISGTRDRSQLFVLSESLRSLGDRLHDTDKTAERIMDIMEQTRERNQLSVLAQSLGFLGGELSDSVAERAFHAFLAANGNLSEPPCASAKTFIRKRKGHLRLAVELLKWPTCSASDQAQLIEEITRITGETFVGEDSSRLDLLKFIDWAEDQGFDPERPPEQVYDHLLP